MVRGDTANVRRTHNDKPIFDEYLFSFVWMHFKVVMEQSILSRLDGLNEIVFIWLVTQVYLVIIYEQTQ